MLTFKMERTIRGFNLQIHDSYCSHLLILSFPLCPGTCTLSVFSSITPAKEITQPRPYHLLPFEQIGNHFPLPFPGATDSSTVSDCTHKEAKRVPEESSTTLPRHSREPLASLFKHCSDVAALVLPATQNTNKKSKHREALLQSAPSHSAKSVQRRGFRVNRR